MIHTTIIPNTRTYTLALDLPQEYLGEEIEVIIFKKQEGFIKPKKKSMADFWGIISDETATELHQSTEDSRKSWEDRLNKQY